MLFRTTRIAAVGIALAVIIQSFPAALAVYPSPFPDMEQSWYRYREAVEFLRNRDVIGGYPDGMFRPKQTINRAEFLKILFKGKSDVEPVHRRCFSDVNPNAWFAPYVCAAKSRGIVGGYPDNTFRADNAVNIAEAIKMTLHAYGHDVKEGSGQEWYVPYAQELERLEVLPRHSYLPWAPLNRERAADLLWRILRREEDRFVPRMSSGCGKSPVTMPPTSVVVRGLQRDFLLTVPSGYVSHDPSPLIVAFHGRTNSNQQVRQYMRLDREIRDSIIAYPAGIRNDNGTFSWADPGDRASYLRDTAFFDALVEELADNYCIDMDRISVIGHSLGGGFANNLACVRGDVILASATVGSDPIITECAGPAAAMIIHNPKDNLTSFAGAERIREQRVKANGCPWETQDTGPEALRCVRHTPCMGTNDVLWCPHTNDIDERGQFYPHNWPRGTAGHIADFLKSIR